MSFASQISNFYEKLVFEELRSRESLSVDEDTLTDMACVALNQLPARYYRYNVDMAFYLPASELETMEKDVITAVTNAIEFVSKRLADR